MLSKFFHVPSWKIGRLSHSINEGFVKVKSVQRKRVSEAHLQNSKSIAQLFENIEIIKSSNQTNLRKLMNKFTQLLLQEKNKKKDKETLQIINKFLYRIRKYSSIQTNSNASELLNYQLMFKQLYQIFADTYKKKGMQIRITVLCQNMPVSTSFEFLDSLAMSLLHYLSCLSHCSQNGLKKQLFYYFYRQNITYERNKIMNLHQNKSSNTQQQPKTKKHHYNPINNLILLNSNQRYQTVTSPHSFITEIAFINLHKNIKQCLIFLKANKLIKIYDNIFSKMENVYVLTGQQKNEVRKQLLLNKFISDLNQQVSNESGDKLWVINSQQKFLHLVNFMVSSLNVDQKQLYNFQFNEKPAYQLLKYFYSVFMMSQNMKIVLSTKREDLSNTQSQEQQKQEQAQNQQQVETLKKTAVPNENDKIVKNAQIKQTYLFKVAHHIMQGAIKNRIYLHKKQTLLRLITFKVLEFIDKLVQLPGNHHQLQQIGIHSIAEQQLGELFKYFTSIMGALKIMPLDHMQEYYKQNKQIHQKIYIFVKQSIEYTTKHYPSTNSQPSPQLLSIKSSLLELLQYKKSLLCTKKQIIQLIKIMMNSSVSYDDYDLYFMLASTNDKQFISLIPFRNMLDCLSRERQKMKNEKRYVNPQSLQSKTQQKMHYEKLQQIKESRKWDAKLLQFYALCIYLNKSDQQIKQLLHRNSPTYYIKFTQIQQLFDIWLSPLSDVKINMLRKNKSTEEQMEQKQNEKQQQYLNIKIEAFERFIPCYTNLFHYLFVQTKCFNQFKLLEKLMIERKQRFLQIAKTLQKKQRNFYICFMTIVLGLADEKNKAKYLQIYNFKDLDIQKFSRHYIYKTMFTQAIERMCNFEQWQYFMSFYLHFNAFQQIRSLFSTYLPINYIYLRSVVNKPDGYQLAYPLGDSYIYSDRQIPRYSPQLKAKLQSTFIKNYLKQLKQSLTVYNSQKPIQRKIASLCLHLYQIYKQTNFEFHIQKQQIKEFQQIFNKSIFPITTLHSKHIFMVGFLNLLTQQHLKKLLSKINDSRKINGLRLTCIRLLTKEKCLKEKIVKQEDLQDIQVDLYKIWSQNPQSLMWILNVYEFCSIQNRVQAFINMYKNLINPMSRRIAYDHLIKRLKKQNISVQDIKFEPQFDEQSATPSIVINFNSNQLHEEHLQLASINFHKGQVDDTFKQQTGADIEGEVAIQNFEQVEQVPKNKSPQNAKKTIFQQNNKRNSSQSKQESTIEKKIEKKIGVFSKKSKNKQQKNEDKTGKAEKQIPIK